MSSHVWERKPTKSKAEALELAYDYALERSATQIQAETFAGYYLERSHQSGGIRSPEGLYKGVVNNDWKLLNGKNAEFYRLAYNRHLQFFFHKLVDLFWERLFQDDFDFVHSVQHGAEVVELYWQCEGQYDTFTKLFRQKFNGEYFKERKVK